MEHYRAVFISDVHLGTHDCKAAALVQFLQNITCEKLYLVGDILDGWYFKKKGFYWPEEHNKVIQEIFKKAKNGTEVIYVTGNHDEFLREYAAAHSMCVGPVKIVNEAEHITKNGERLWVVHGDEYDIGMVFYKALEWIISTIWILLFWAGWLYDKTIGVFKKERVSFVNMLKQKIRFVSELIQLYEKELVRETKFKGYDGVICGHIHVTKYMEQSQIKYWNCGDWVDSCSAVVEDTNGKFHILTNLKN